MNITPPDSRTDPLDTLAVQTADIANQWTDGTPTIGADPTARELLKQVAVNMTTGAAAIRASAEEARGWENNLDIHPDGRKARAAEAREAGLAKAAEASSSSAEMLDIAESMLIHASAPSWGDTANKQHNAQTLARQDALMLLNGADAKNLADRVRVLAEQDGPLSTLVTSGDWLALYLNSRGINQEDAGVIMDAAREFALAKRAERGNVNAVLAYKVRRNLRAGLSSLNALSRHSSR